MTIYPYNPTSFTQASDSDEESRYLSPSIPSRELLSGLALVVGAWVPGIPGQFETVAIDMASNDRNAIQEYVMKNNESYCPNYTCDFLQVPDNKRYARIVFLGCCPVSSAMGARRCSANGRYGSIPPQAIAKKINRLIQDGGYVFISHCLETANPSGIKYPEKRTAFIEAFKRKGFEPLDESHPAALSGPGGDIPDPPEEHYKWHPQNGGLTLYKIPSPKNRPDEITPPS